MREDICPVGDDHFASLVLSTHCLGLLICHSSGHPSGQSKCCGMAFAEGENLSISSGDRRIPLPSTWRLIALVRVCGEQCAVDASRWIENRYGCTVSGMNVKPSGICGTVPIHAEDYATSDRRAAGCLLQRQRTRRYVLSATVMTAPDAISRSR